MDPKEKIGTPQNCALEMSVRACAYCYHGRHVLYFCLFCVKSTILESIWGIQHWTYNLFIVSSWALWVLFCYLPQRSLINPVTDHGSSYQGTMIGPWESGAASYWFLCAIDIVVRYIVLNVCNAMYFPREMWLHRIICLTQ